MNIFFLAVSTLLFGAAFRGVLDSYEIVTM